MPDPYDFLLERLLPILRAHSVRSVMDYGCGTGTFLERIGERAGPEVSLVGVDFLSRYPEAERPRSDERRRFIERGAGEFDTLLEDGPQFDLILSTFALHHYRNPIEELQRLQSLLNPGGFLFVADMSFDYSTDARRTKSLCTYVGEMFDAFRGKFHRHHYSLEEALDLFRALQLELLEATGHEIPISLEEMEQQADGYDKHFEHLSTAIPQFESEVLESFFTTALGSVRSFLPVAKVDPSAIFVILARKAARLRAAPRPGKRSGRRPTSR